MQRLLPLVSLFLVAVMVSPVLAKDRVPKNRAPKVKTTKVQGVVARADATSLAVTLRKAKGAAAAEVKTVDVGTSTKVQVQTAEDETTTNRRGQEVKRPKVADGTLADVKVGAQVTVTVSEDGKSAVSILVHRAHAKKHK